MEFMNTLKQSKQRFKTKRRRHNMAVKLTPKLGESVFKVISEANTIVSEAILAACTTSDFAAALFLGLDAESSAALSKIRKSQTSALISNTGAALFSPVLDAGQLRLILTGGYAAKDVEDIARKRLKLVQMDLNPLRTNIATVITANAAAIKSWQKCGRSGDPVASALMGVSEEFLSLMAHVSETRLCMAFEDARLPIFQSRFSGAAVLTGIYGNGCNSATAHREIVKHLSI
jgi:hypothetical protein